jgi:hypothetical protein
MIPYPSALYSSEGGLQHLSIWTLPPDEISFNIKSVLDAKYISTIAKGSMPLYSKQPASISSASRLHPAVNGIDT